MYMYFITNEILMLSAKIIIRFSYDYYKIAWNQIYW